MHDDQEPIPPELMGIVRTLAHDHIARHGSTPEVEQQARRAYAYLDIRQFKPLWLAAVQLHAAERRRQAP